MKHLHSEWLRKHTCLQRWIVRHVFNAAVPETKITFLVQIEFFAKAAWAETAVDSLTSCKWCSVRQNIHPRHVLVCVHAKSLRTCRKTRSGAVLRLCHYHYFHDHTRKLSCKWARQASERLTSRPEWARPPGLQNQGRTNWVPAGSFASTEQSVQAGERSLSPRAGASWGPACGSKAELQLSCHHSCSAGWMDPSCAFLRLTLLHWNNRRSSGWSRQRQGPTPQTPPGQTFPAALNWRFGKHTSWHHLSNRSAKVRGMEAQLGWVTPVIRTKVVLLF